MASDDVVSAVARVAVGRPLNGVKEIGGQILNPRASQGQRPSLADTGAGSVNMTVDQRKSMLRGDAIYRELCTTCHAPDGKGAPMQGAADGARLAPPLAASPRVQGHRDYVVKVLLQLVGKEKTLEGKKVAVVGGTTEANTVKNVIVPGLKKIGVDGMFVKKRDAMRKGFTPGADLGEIALGHGELRFGLVPGKKSAFAKDAAIAKVERDRAADRGDHHHKKVICKAATQSHDAHGITTRFTEQAKSSVDGGI